MPPKRLLPFILPFVLLLSAAALALPGAGCGGGGEQTSTSPPVASQESKTYSDNPESVSRLLKDTSATLGREVSAGAGVHFTMDSTTTVAGQTVVSSGEGDMVFPTPLKMTTRNYTGGPSSPPVPVDVIMTGGVVYTRTAGGAWQSSQTAQAPDPGIVSTYLDYARSSQFLGQETLGNGRKTYHVQVNVDTALAAEKAKQQTSDPVLQKSLEDTKSSTVTLDLWLGVDDQLIYQEKINVNNPATGLSSNLNFIFANWGETVSIEKPCAAC